MTKLTNTSSSKQLTVGAKLRRGPKKSAGRMARVKRVLAHDPSLTLAVLVLAFIVFVVIFAPLIAPVDPNLQSAKGIEKPSGEHLLGTDDRGRDVLSRLIYGGRASLGISFSVVLLATLVSVPLGLIAGYRRGRFDFGLMRLAEVGLSIPPLVLALTVASVLGVGAVNTTLALTIVFVPGLMRLVRGQAMAVSSETFVEASRAIGTPGWRILLIRVLPSTASPLIVQATVMLSGALLAEAALSFLGLGTRPPDASWGSMLRSAYDAALFTDSWLVVIPALAIAITVLCINKVGDGLRQALGLSRQVKRDRRSILGLTTANRPSQEARTQHPDASTGKPALQIENLTVELQGGGTPIRVVEGLSLTVGRGEILGLVGESGAGKSLTAMASMRLLASPPMRITKGTISVNGVDVLSRSRTEMRKLRGPEIAMIFQDPMTSLDPAFTIGHHLAEAIHNHEKASKRTAQLRAVELLELVGITEPARRLHNYPHELSGGMRQRVMIAIALSSRPRILIADEPTTALDVTIQAQILDLLKRLVRELDMSMLIVSHDLGVIADVCDRVAVVYAGQLIEEADVFDLFANPQQPYTEGLLRSMPRLEETTSRLRVIKGSVPALNDIPAGCRFAARCEYRTSECEAGTIPLQERSGGGWVRCRRAEELRLIGTSSSDVAALSAGDS
jgi:peptide/nickel transport system permease protein